ncbi:MAG: DNA gyrase inhibitor YacG [Pseudomonadota bacterium]
MNRTAPARAAPRCPICGAPRQDAWRPFCSKRCADIDLGRWMTETYRTPAVESAQPEDEADRAALEAIRARAAGGVDPDPDPDPDPERG